MAVVLRQPIRRLAADKISGLSDVHLTHIRSHFKGEREMCRVELKRAQPGMSPWLTFLRAPLSSRTVGFPESGWQQQLSLKDLPMHTET